MDWNLIFTVSLTTALGPTAIVFALAAVGLNIQFGYTGLVNFGQVAFLAIGAYTVAMGVDTFGLLAYEHGLRLTSSLIIGGTSTALVLFVGFLLLGEPVTWLRVLAIALVATGILLFQLEGG